MKLLAKRTLTLLTFVIVWGAMPLSAQLREFTMQSGQVVLKTNPLMYFRPEVNLSAEVGIRENLSLEGRLTWFPAARWPDGSTWVAFPSARAGGVTAHVQVRHYLRGVPFMFFSWGMLFKQWEYRDYDVVRDEFEVEQCYLENRRALVLGPRALYGFRLPLFNERAVFETYGGFSLKFRFDEVFRRDNGQCFSNTATLGQFREQVTLLGINTGFNLGIFLNRP